MAFGQELKDFVSAYQAGYSLVKSKAEKEREALDLEATRSDIDYRGAQTENLRNPKAAPMSDFDRARIAQINQDMDVQLNPDKYPGARLALEAREADIASTRAGTDRTAAQTAVMLNPADFQTPNDLANYELAVQRARGQNLENTEAQRQAGAFSTYAGQGAVPGASSTGAATAIPPAAAGALPFSPEPVKTGAAAAVDAMATGAEIPEASVSREAVKAGMEGAMALASQSVPTAVPAGSAPAGGSPAPTREAMAAYVRGAGAAQPTLFQQAVQAVDPEGKMTEAERNFNAMGAIYSFYVNQGDMQSAQNAAVQMVQHMRIASSRYQALAAAAAEGGNLDAAAQGMVRAYANVPDGKDLKVKANEDGDYVFEFTDIGTGQVMQQKILSPEELAAAAMNVSPQNFDEFISRAAGVAPKAKDELSSADRERYQGMVADSVSMFSEDPNNLPEVFDLMQDNKYAAPVRDAAYALLINNNSMSSDEAVETAASFLKVNPPTKNEDGSYTPAGVPYKVTMKGGRPKVDSDGNISVKFTGHSFPVSMPLDAFRQLDNLRAERANAANEDFLRKAARDEVNALEMQRVKDAAPGAAREAVKFLANPVATIWGAVDAGIRRLNYQPDRIQAIPTGPAGNPYTDPDLEAFNANRRY